MTYSFAESLALFPEGIPAAKRAAKEELKLAEGEISSLSDFRDLVMNDINKLHFKKQSGYIEWLNDFIDRARNRYEKDVRKYQYQLEHIENLKNPKEEKGDPITPERIARAKEYPIKDLLDFPHGRNTNCIFHDDHRPSLHLYPDNHVYCFACGHSADAIDVWMKLRGATFHEAVRAMAP